MLFFVFIIYACTQSTFVEVRGKQNNTMVTCIENIEATENLIIIENSMLEIQNINSELPETTHVFYDQFIEE